MKNDAMETINDQVKQLSGMQQSGFEPMRAFGSAAVEVFEQMTRKNYTLVGDMIDFSIKQASLPLRGESLNDTLTAQVNESKAFVELMNQRGSEYMELVASLSNKFRDAGNYAAASVKSV